MTAGGRGGDEGAAGPGRPTASWYNRGVPLDRLRRPFHSASPPEVHAQAHSLSWFYLVSAVLYLLTLVAPHDRETTVGVVALAAACLPAAAFLRVLAHGLRPWAPVAFLILGIGVVSAAVALSTGGVSVAAASFYIWLVLVGFQLFPASLAWAETVVAAIAYGAVLLSGPSPGAGVEWVLVMGTAVVAGILTGAAAHRLRSAARSDPLTGLPNRAAFMEELGREVRQARRAGEPLVVAALDIDGFKTINDTYGHQRGDAILVEASRQWAGVIRPRDRLARLGGDEFVLLLPGTSRGQAEAVLERVRTVAVPCSAGASQYRPGDDPSRLLSRADAALYADKRRRRGAAGAAGRR